MNIQTSLRQWSSSTLNQAHREEGFAAANHIDALEGENETLLAKIGELELQVAELTLEMQPDKTETIGES